MKQENFEIKDRILNEIKNKYINKSLSDNDLLSMGKYFSYYARYDLADYILKPRIDKLDVNTDLLFFYINLSILRGEDFTLEHNRKMLLNAIGIDGDRFCALFNSTDLGGISMQLLLDPFWKGYYCENCKGYKK